MRLRARRLQVRALKRTASLPSGVLGPVDFRALCWLAACCFSDINISKSFFRFHDRERERKDGWSRWGDWAVSDWIGWGWDYFRDVSPGIGHYEIWENKATNGIGAETTILGRGQRKTRDTCACRYELPYERRAWDVLVVRRVGKVRHFRGGLFTVTDGKPGGRAAS